MKSLGRVLVFACALMLSACGGGGDDGKKPADVAAPAQQEDDTSPVVPVEPGLQLSATRLGLTYEVGDDATTAQIDGVVNGAKEDLFVDASTSVNGLAYVYFALSSASSGRLNVVAKTGLAPGVYNDEIHLKVCYDKACQRPVLGSPKTILVTLQVRAPSPVPTILPGKHGLSFAKVPSGAHLAEDVVVAQSGALPGDWVAQANVPWLEVTPSGAPGGTLSVRARPEGLSPGLHVGAVGIGPAVQGAARGAVVRVSLYISEQPSAEAFDAPVGTSVRVDPARPFVYSIQGAKVVVDHVHTGRRLLALGVPGVAFGEMTMNPEGTRLLIIDADQTRVWIFDTEYGVFRGVIPLPMAKGTYEARRTPVVFKVNGRDVLVVVGLTPNKLTGGYFMVDLNAGMPLAQVFTAASWQHDTVEVARDGRHFVVHTHLSHNSMRWGEMTENSRGRLLPGVLVGGNTGTYVTTDYFIATSGLETISCQGILRPHSNLSDYTSLDTSLVDTFSWSTPRPNYVDERLKKQCTGIEPILGDDQFLMTDAEASEFQVRRRDGSLVARWPNERQLTGLMKVSSDHLRVFDGRTLMDLRWPSR